MKYLKNYELSQTNNSQCTVKYRRYLYPLKKDDLVKIINIFNNCYTDYKLIRSFHQMVLNISGDPDYFIYMKICDRFYDYVENNDIPDINLSLIISDNELNSYGEVDDDIELEISSLKYNL